MGRLRDLTGQKFGRLTVISIFKKRINKRVLWRCLCNCGKETLANSYQLISKKTKSCGCLRIENNKTINIKHSMSDSDEFKIWSSMKTRCNNKNRSYFYCYGGRGIKVCEQWLNSFEQFYKDMGPRPSKLHSIDRIDNDGNYEPSNCRWATKKEQNNNCRSNHRILYNNENLTISQWSKKINISDKTIRSRLKLGWSIDKILTTKVRLIKTKNF